MDNVSKNTLTYIAKYTNQKRAAELEVINGTFNEVYENLEAMDERLTHMQKDECYLGTSFCGAAYLRG